MNCVRAATLPSSVGSLAMLLAMRLASSLSADLGGRTFVRLNRSKPDPYALCSGDRAWRDSLWWHALWCAGALML
jgi:hypothetical protein